MKKLRKIPLEIIQFDVVTYLQYRNIPISYQSTHTSAGYVNIQCPFCGDSSDHLGINLTTKIANCWLCGGKDIVRIVAMIEGGCSLAEANTIIREFRNASLGYAPEETVRRSGRRNIIPAYATDNFSDVHLDYLRRRQFDPDVVIPQYKLLAIGQGVRYKWRILIPVIQNGRVVTFTCADVTGKQELKYDACNNEQSLIPIKETLYNIDSVHRTMLIVEGVTDVWRVGEGAVCVFGLQFTPAQLSLIANKQVEKAVVLFDGEDRNHSDFLAKHRKTMAQAKKLAFSLKGVVKNVDVLEMSHGDPGDLSTQEVHELRGLVFYS